MPAAVDVTHQQAVADAVGVTDLYNKVNERNNWCVMIKSDDVLFEQFVDKTRKIYGDNLQSVFLYGSVARGTAQEDSDVDIALLVLSDDDIMYDKLLDIVVEFELEYDIVISTVLIESYHFKKWSDTLPFYKNIINEGIELWKAA